MAIDYSMKRCYEVIDLLILQFICEYVSIRLQDKVTRLIKIINPNLNLSSRLFLFKNYFNLNNN